MGERQTERAFTGREEELPKNEKNKRGAFGIILCSQVLLVSNPCCRLFFFFRDCSNLSLLQSGRCSRDRRMRAAAGRPVPTLSGGASEREK